MDESSPLAPERHSHQQVRRNLFRTFQHEIYTSYILFTFSFLLTITKIITAYFILHYNESETETPLSLWNKVNLLLDISYLFLKILRYPYIKRAREGEEVEESISIQIGFIVQTTVYVVWQVPGNIWFWRCQHCFEDAAALTGFTLANLILAYLYLLIPALILLSICACLPVAIIFVMIITGDSQRPASDDLLKALESEVYDSEKHLGDSSCTICAAEYVKGEEVVVMKCDPRHFFHKECIKKWLQINANCPICRATYSCD